MQLRLVSPSTHELFITEILINLNFISGRPALFPVSTRLIFKSFLTLSGTSPHYVCVLFQRCTYNPTSGHLNAVGFSYRLTKRVPVAKCRTIVSPLGH